MFNKNEKNPPNSSPQTSLEVCNIALGTTVDGDLKSDGNMRLDGTVNGNINCGGRLVMSTQAVVIGDIVCRNLRTEGKIEGDVVAKELIHLLPTASIDGNIQYKNLQIETGAVFNGQAISNKNNSKPKELPKTNA